MLAKINISAVLMRVMKCFKGISKIIIKFKNRLNLNL